MKEYIQPEIEVKISNLETQIAKTGIMSARSEYFPKLGFMMGTEYTKNYRDVKYYRG